MSGATEKSCYWLALSIHTSGYIDSQPDLEEALTDVFTYTVSYDQVFAPVT